MHDAASLGSPYSLCFFVQVWTHERGGGGGEFRITSKSLVEIRSLSFRKSFRLLPLMRDTLLSSIHHKTVLLIVQVSDRVGTCLFVDIDWTTITINNNVICFP